MYKNDSLYFQNKYPDYHPQARNGFKFVEEKILSLIMDYVNQICANNPPNPKNRFDLYVGDAGIAYMFLKMSQCSKLQMAFTKPRALEKAEQYIQSAKKGTLVYSAKSTSPSAFLCGKAGVYAVSSAISSQLQNTEAMERDLEIFGSCYENSLVVNANEILVGRAGYLCGCLWLQQQIKSDALPTDEQVLKLCEVITDNGRTYARDKQTPMPLMFEYHGKEYLGAAHGLAGILLMLLKSPLFSSETDKYAKMKHGILSHIKTSIDKFVELQDVWGNFPSKLNNSNSHLVHWCHGAPGVVYLLAKAYLIFKEEKYLNSCIVCADLCWKKGLLRKGPGICHGVAGNGYVFLIVYRLTRNKKYLYRAYRFMEFLSDEMFLAEARTPDRPYSLFEGLAGTVCFLVDLLEAEQAEFPFFDIFNS